MTTHKHLGMITDCKISYENHFQLVFSRVNKTIVLLRKLQLTLPRKSPVTTKKSFIRPHLDFGGVACNQASSELFRKRLECLSYGAAIAVSGTFRGTWYEQLFQKLGLETLKLRRGLRNS